MISKQLALIILSAVATVLSHCFAQLVSAAQGDTIRVVSHNETLVVTDPSTGSMSYVNTVIFPSREVDYRKAILTITYSCPDGLHCGEWDYIDAVYLAKRGLNSAKPVRLEIARMISPYGWRFDSTWSFSWHTDITDFAPQCHDSVDIEFVHTGYESNTDRGWIVTIDFTLIEGRPAMRQIGMDTLWCGTIPYGDTAKPTESLLKPLTIRHDSAAIARVRILQTGHGMDDSANCAEFCKKYRRLYLDDSLINERFIWRECADNPLYPQAGTWIFDRANWCPGSIVVPDMYDLPISDHKEHTVNIDMEPYINPNKPSANYHVSAYLFYYEKPWAENDVSIEEVLVPSNSPEYSRMNPSYGQLKFVAKNNGSKTISQMMITWDNGSGGVTKTLWRGELRPLMTDTISLSSPEHRGIEHRLSAVTLENPNGMDDEYPSDNSASSLSASPPDLPGTFVALVRTNAQPEHNDYLISDGSGRSVLHRGASDMLPGTVYRDTLHLAPGNYTFLMTDTADDGLDFWFNPEGGYGYIRFLTLDGTMLKSVNADFGREARFCFEARSDAKPPTPNPQPIIQIFPPRNKGIFAVDLFYDTASATTIMVVSDSTKDTVYTRNIGIVKEIVHSVDISAHPDGIYYAHVISGNIDIPRRIRIKRGD